MGVFGRLPFSLPVPQVQLDWNKPYVLPNPRLPAEHTQPMGSLWTSLPRPSQLHEVLCGFFPQWRHHHHSEKGFSITRELHGLKGSQISSCLVPVEYLFLSVFRLEDAKWSTSVTSQFLTRFVFLACHWFLDNSLKPSFLFCQQRIYREDFQLEVFKVSNILIVATDINFRLWLDWRKSEVSSEPQLYDSFKGLLKIILMPIPKSYKLASFFTKNDWL